ncbi:hypothetical protein O9K51_00650 [Purpureocillium lavendulum]|uniref:Uncharacterized protein n=1 Tax=Purpureocillium lavendulum TaxID=1247861 RepID=A0AB34G2P6_9HYPO|nr:hypothetical protein O9K51_00650 [Purpureocillium lavendulum]
MVKFSFFAATVAAAAGTVRAQGKPKFVCDPPGEMDETRACDRGTRRAIESIVEWGADNNETGWKRAGYLNQMFRDGTLLKDQKECVDCKQTNKEITNAVWMNRIHVIVMDYMLRFPLSTPADHFTLYLQLERTTNKTLQQELTAYQPVYVDVDCPTMANERLDELLKQYPKPNDQETPSSPEEGKETPSSPDEGKDTTSPDKGIETSTSKESTMVTKFEGSIEAIVTVNGSIRKAQFVVEATVAWVSNTVFLSKQLKTCTEWVSGKPTPEEERQMKHLNATEYTFGYAKELLNGVAATFQGVDKALDQAAILYQDGKVDVNEVVDTMAKEVKSESGAKTSGTQPAKNKPAKNCKSRARRTAATWAI